jgi:hypothetical protein
MQKFSVNAGFYSRLGLKLFNYSETADSQLNVRKPYRLQV